MLKILFFLKFDELNFFCSLAVGRTGGVAVADGCVVSCYTGSYEYIQRPLGGIPHGASRARAHRLRAAAGRPTRFALEIGAWRDHLAYI